MVDFRNNVIYNWGYKASYGGGRHGEINIVANYYKPGPGTICSHKFLDISADRTGRYYVAENCFEGDRQISEDNWKGVGGDSLEISKVKVPFAYEPIQQDSPLVAYRKVLNQVGCSFRRDKYDKAIIRQVKKGISPYGHNGFIDTPLQAGGWPVLHKGKVLKDSDMDGMPDVWEKTKGLNPYDDKDARLNTLDKDYTNIEVYINNLVR